MKWVWVKPSKLLLCSLTWPVKKVADMKLCSVCITKKCLTVSHFIFIFFKSELGPPSHHCPHQRDAKLGNGVETLVSWVQNPHLLWQSEGKKAKETGTEFPLVVTVFSGISLQKWSFCFCIYKNRPWQTMYRTLWKGKKTVGLWSSYMILKSRQKIRIEDMAEQFYIKIMICLPSFF